MTHDTVRDLARFCLGNIATSRKHARPPREGERFAYSEGLSEAIAAALGEAEQLRPFIYQGHSGPELGGVADELEAALRAVAEAS